jgi:WD40 repeat protein
MRRYDVFLSHAGPDKPAVEYLATKLREAGIDPFLDKWHLIPGEPWQEALEEALDHSRTCAVFLGKTLGPWQNEEMRSALADRVHHHSIRVIPVLLPGGRQPGKEELPRFLRRLTWVDFRAGLDDEDAFRRLLAGIRGEEPGPGSSAGGVEKPPLPYRCMAPARESFVPRREYEEAVQALLASGQERAATVGLTTALQGAGGFGKTALATELCYDPRIRERYPDGVLWTTMGEEIDTAGRLARVRDLIRWWTEADPPAFETVSAASAHLRQELEGKRVLLVVDDVWRPEDVTPFQGLGSVAALLVTTRDSRTLPAGSVPIHVDAMDVPEAVRLLGAGLPDGMTVDLQKLVTRLGEWPLLLKIVNRQLRELIQQDGLSLEQSLREVNEALDAEGLIVFDREDLESRGQAVVRTVGASLRRLSGEEVDQFEQLAIFPEDKDIPLRVLEKLWSLGAFATKKLCGRFHDLSLLLRFDRQSGTIRLHDVIRAYLLKKRERQLAGWNTRLLDAHRPANGRWPDLPREESYLWNHLFHHLVGAGQSDVCRKLLFNFEYLRSKLRATDVNFLIADYSYFAEKNIELWLVHDALRLSAHVLSQNPAQLREQLWGRLLERKEAGILDLLQESEGSGAPWLRPREASLTKPGGPLIRIIEPLEIPSALTVLPDGRLVSGSYTGELQVWDVESGRSLYMFKGNSRRVRAVAALDNRRVVSGSDDGTLRVWDIESGQALNIFKGSSLQVLAVAVLDSRRVVSGSADGMLWIWDAESGQTLQVLKGHAKPVTALAVSDNSVISSSSDGTVRVWNVESGQVLKVFQGYPYRLTAAVVLNSRQIVAGSADGTMLVWDIEHRKALHPLAGHSARIFSMAVLDSRRVVSGSADGTVRVWDIESNQALQVFEGHSAQVSAVTALDSRRVVSCSSDRTLRVWDVVGERALQALEGHSGPVLALAVLDSRCVVSASHDKTLRVWDVESGKTREVFQGHSKPVKGLAVLDDRHVVSCSDDSIRVWNVDGVRTRQAFVRRGAYSVAKLENSRIISFSKRRGTWVWDFESGRTILKFKHRFVDSRVLLVLDSRYLIVSSGQALRVGDLESGKTVQAFEGHSKPVNAAVLMDSGRVVSGADDKTLIIWDLKNGEVLQVLEGHLGGVSAVAGLDSRRVVSGSFDRTLRVWDMESGKIECQFTLDAPVTAVAVVPDCRVIVAGDATGRVHFFDFVEP